MRTLCIVLTFLFGCVAVAAQERPARLPPDFRVDVTRTKEKEKLTYETFATDASRMRIARFESKREFVEFVAKMKKGQWILWDSGCFLYDYLPLGSERLPIQDAIAICAKAEVKFTYQCGF